VAFKNKLEDDINKTKSRLIAAEKLTQLLADEGVRWTEEIKTID
jgi:dynein heavy chain